MAAAADWWHVSGKPTSLFFQMSSSSDSVCTRFPCTHCYCYLNRLGEVRYRKFGQTPWYRVNTFCGTLGRIAGRDCIVGCGLPAPRLFFQMYVGLCLGNGGRSIIFSVRLFFFLMDCWFGSLGRLFREELIGLSFINWILHFGRLGWLFSACF